MHFADRRCHFLHIAITQCFRIISGKRCNRGVTLELAIQSFVALAVNADISRCIEEVRASQVSCQVVQVSSCPANIIGRSETTPAHLQLAHSVVGLQLTCR